ncbi:P-loop ATPase, Sll1717 family [Streptomyces sp. NPDC101178]|uniref:P-loop ATPase, Sll1717 family n=1 Tax=Streptomyces sp. NPDC101178 TaxID=3366124 RepID=UPI003810984C
MSRLSFGKDDAENDVTVGLLSPAVFQETYAYREALSGRKSLIIGRKGAGKSAICQQLVSPGGHPGPTAVITPDDATSNEIRRFELVGVTEDTAKSLIWRYLFAVQAAQEVVAHARASHGRRTPTSVRALRKFLEANGEAGEERLYDRLRRGVLGLQSASLSLKAFGVEAAVEMAGAPEGARADRQLGVLERGVALAFEELGCATAHEPLLLLVDKVDHGWTIDPDSHSLVTGLLLAAKHVTGAYGGAVRCVLFVRSDIYDSLRFSDADKFRSDELHISWNQRGLEDLALARARASLKVDLSAEQLWGQLFPAEVSGEPITAYLFRRSLPRPRDAIQFLNLCRDAAHERDNGLIGEDDVIAATERFSSRKLNDLATEYQVNHPYLDALYPMFENTGYIVMRQALETRLAARAERLRQEFADYADSLTPAGVISVLYGIGFLGVKRGNDVVYAGGPKAPPQPGEDEFHVHPCFRPALGSQGPVELTAYSPTRVESRSRTAIGPLHSDVGLGVSREVQLLGQVIQSCERLLRRLARAGLPESIRAAVHTQVSHVLGDARAVLEELRAGSSVDVSRHVLAASGYFDAIAVQLSGHGFQDEPITRGFADEARLLLRAVGGAVGGGRGSSSSG